jgi:hypothetical protein
MAVGLTSISGVSSLWDTVTTPAHMLAGTHGGLLTFMWFCPTVVKIFQEKVVQMTRSKQNMLRSN